MKRGKGEVGGQVVVVVVAGSAEREMRREDGRVLVLLLFKATELASRKRGYLAATIDACHMG